MIRGTMTGHSPTERIRGLEGGGSRAFIETEPLVWERAHGAWVETAGGGRYLDLYAGYAVAATGHAHPAVVRAVQAQAGVLMHCPSAHPSEIRARFLESLHSVAPSHLDRILPAITGAMANELALALIRHNRPGRPVIAFTGGYLGRSLGIVGLSGKTRYRTRLGVEPGAQFVPYPDPRRPDATRITIEELDRLASAAGGIGPPAAVILEPIQGNAGVLIPPPDFLPALRDFCDRHQSLLGVDEIQSGCGRTGKWWAIDHTGVHPDLMTVGKGIGGGMAVAAVLGRGELMTWEPDTYTSTFLTNAVNLAAAVAAIGVMVEEGLPERAARLGPPVLETLSAGLKGNERVAEIRGIGLWAGIELIDREGEPDPTATAAVAAAARRRGVIVGRGGLEDNVIKLSPPLVVDETDLKGGVEKVIEAVEEATR